MKRYFWMCESWILNLETVICLSKKESWTTPIKETTTESIAQSFWWSVWLTAATSHSHICLTVDGEVYSVLSVPSGERGVFADVGGLVRQAEGGEGDGGVLKSRSPSPHCCVLEGDAVPVGRGHGHAEGGVGDCHVLLCAVHQFLPCHLEKERCIWVSVIHDSWL